MHFSSTLRVQWRGKGLPIADKVFISPTSADDPYNTDINTAANSGDAFFGFYEYKDPNNDPEKGTILTWFKN